MRSTPRPGDGQAHREHVAQAPAALRRRRPARRLAHVDDHPLEPIGNRRPDRADGRSTKTVNSCSVGCRDSASSNCRREPAEPAPIGKAASVDSDSHGRALGAIVAVRSPDAFDSVARCEIAPASVKAGAPTEPAPAAESTAAPRSVRSLGVDRNRVLRAAAQQPVATRRSRPRARSSSNRAGEEAGRAAAKANPLRRARNAKKPRFKRDDRGQADRQRRPRPGDARRRASAGEQRQPGQGHARLLAEP